MTNKNSEQISIVVIGASGDLSRKKIFPALFALFCQQILPDNVRIFGFARTDMDDAAFRRHICEHLTCRYMPDEFHAEKINVFLERCHYVRGEYGSTDSILNLYKKMRKREEGKPANRLYYLAIPPPAFIPVAKALGNAGLISCGGEEPWSRVVVEKPFGRDRDSSDKLAEALRQVFDESQIFRIDHYLGKEVIQNLLILRFANSVFEPLWNNKHIAAVRINWSENLSLEGRAGYFDQFGIIRDVMQNHLLETMALTAMDAPDGMNASAIRKRKVELLNAIEPPSMDNIVTGQFSAGEINGRHIPAYNADINVPDDSLTPTYAATRLKINNARWKNVPFFLSAGKGLASRQTDIRVIFRNQFVIRVNGRSPPANELVIRVQPREGIHLSITTKIPGLGMNLGERNLNLSYGEAFRDTVIPEAYEGLLLEVLRGDSSLFIGAEELAAAWNVFTPVLHAMENNAVRPLPYKFGGEPPAPAMRLLEESS